MRNKLVPGDYNVICDYSGFKCKRSECRLTWDGFLVRKDFWEERHPQDYVKGVKDDQRVADPRPERTDTYLSSNVNSEDL